jgi:hypothetical protein
MIAMQSNKERKSQQRQGFHNCPAAKMKFNHSSDGRYVKKKEQAALGRTAKPAQTT